ncbi:MarR family transcriptional regulator [Mucilaginibacter sp. RS28]|uniref:MarR family transcriptional regulator n=1 Tax=Mucilaginibacter straminoryzae TaxID=2932774 RepID=A0A9X2BAA6_9SPHI|nr:MarR family transcriptional regulator [Mucilaginibacter straminoryzae]MCJ8211201.1 MarR family transcriptional regulator [Mucilaginibacter straminoryzae]
MEKLDDILFYQLDKAIRTYRQFAQHRIMSAGFELTIDQWLVLQAIVDDPNRNQQEVAEAAFKDFASVTRIIELLVKKGFLNRSIHPDDRRRFLLTPTEKTDRELANIRSITMQNRKTALKGIPEADFDCLHQCLNQIINNCKKS